MSQDRKDKKIKTREEHLLSYKLKVTWNSNWPRLFRYRLCKYSTFV